MSTEYSFQGLQHCSQVSWSQTQKYVIQSHVDGETLEVTMVTMIVSQHCLAVVEFITVKC